MTMDKEMISKSYEDGHPFWGLTCRRSGELKKLCQPHVSHFRHICDVHSLD
jgi:hypothetical protein